jgi:hypothetical protein
MCKNTPSEVLSDIEQYGLPEGSSCSSSWKGARADFTLAFDMFLALLSSMTKTT